MKHKLFLFLPVIFLLFGCVLITNQDDPLVNFSDDDPEMNAAIQEAQDTLDVFISNLNAPKPSQTYFSIKARFPTDDSGGYEHIWLDDISYDGTVFNGIIGNEVYYVPGLEYGDFVSVSRVDVTDWLIIEDGYLLGGYTLRVIYCNMSSEEQEQFRNEIDFVIDESCNGNN